MSINQPNAVAVKNDTIDLVEAKIAEFQRSGALHFPANYSPQNALKSAWLMLQETVDRDKRPVLSVCTRPSIANALLSMCIQGLNPDKKQCYFIAYGDKLNLQRSYFGSMAVAKRVDESIVDIYADVVYKGDSFKYKKHRGKTIIVEHIQQLENIKKTDIIAAYAVIVYDDDREIATIMTIDEIKQAWAQSQMRPIENGNIKAGTTHDKFAAEMCKKTVINRACKAVINSSDDHNLVARYAKETELVAEETSAQEEIKQNANATPIDIDYTITDDTPETSSETTSETGENPIDVNPTLFADSTSGANTGAQGNIQAGPGF